MCRRRTIAAQIISESWTDLCDEFRNWARNRFVEKEAKWIQVIGLLDVVSKFDCLDKKILLGKYKSSLQIQVLDQE